MLGKCKGGGFLGWSQGLMLASARRGVKPPPYKSNRKRVQRQGCGPGMPGPYGRQTKRLHTQNGVQLETV